MTSGKGKVGLVTGASSGIGRATAIALAREGWSLALTARREEELQATLEMCKAASATPFSGIVVKGDVTDEAFVKELFSTTVKHFGRLDMLFNNAGVSAPPTLTEDLELETFARVMNTNVIGPFLCTREAMRIFRSQKPKGGRIINNGSLSAHTPRPHSIAYTTSKHAISGLTKSIALDGRRDEITCTQVDIGNVYTSLSTGGSVGGDTGSDDKVLHIQPYGQKALEAIFDVVHVASQIASVAALPNSVTVLWLNVMATDMPFVGRG